MARPVLIDRIGNRQMAMKIETQKGEEKQWQIR